MKKIIILSLILSNLIFADAIEYNKVDENKDTPAKTIDKLFNIHRDGGEKKEKSEKNLVSIAGIQDDVMLSDKNISRIFLSFEEEKKEAREAEEKAKKEAEEKRIEEEKRREATKGKILLGGTMEQAPPKKNEALAPSLEEQLLAFESKLAEDGKGFVNGIASQESNTTAILMPQDPIYGVFCDSILGCYAIGENITYRKGNTINGKEIKSINAHKIVFTDNSKMWFSR